MKKTLGLVLPLIAVLAFSGSGCGKAKPDLVVLVDNANGVEAKSKVTWRGVEVGEVTAILPESGKIRMDVKLAPDHQGQIRLGATAKAMRNMPGQQAPTLVLFGGTDLNAPLLPEGSQIPEASLLETLQYVNFWDWLIVTGYGKPTTIGVGVLLVVVFIAWKILKGISKLMVLGLAVLLVVGSFWVFRMQWDKHKASLVSPELQQQIDTYLHFDLTSPAAREAWNSIRTDFGDILAQAKERGGAAIDAAKAKAESELAKKADELRTQGNETAAQELEKMKGVLSSF